MKKFLVAASLLFAATSAHAAKTIEVNFSYEAPADSFTLYMDGKSVCSAQNTNITSFICDDLTMDYGVHMFTMTATAGGIETLHSPPYTFAYKPTMQTAPAMIQVRVIIDGVEQIVNP